MSEGQRTFGLGVLERKTAIQHGNDRQAFRRRGAEVRESPRRTCVAAVMALSVASLMTPSACSTTTREEACLICCSWPTCNHAQYRRHVQVGWHARQGNETERLRAAAVRALVEDLDQQGRRQACLRPCLSSYARQGEGDAVA